MLNIWKHPSRNEVSRLVSVLSSGRTLYFSIFYRLQYCRRWCRSQSSVTKAKCSKCKVGPDQFQTDMLQEWSRGEKRYFLLFLVFVEVVCNQLMKSCSSVLMSGTNYPQSGRCARIREPRQHFLDVMCIQTPPSAFLLLSGPCLTFRPSCAKPITLKPPLHYSLKDCTCFWLQAKL